MRQHLLFRGAGVDAQTAVARIARSLLAAGNDDRFADAHEADGDAGSLAGAGVAEIDTGVGSGGDSQEFALRQVSEANYARLAKKGVERPAEVRGDDLASQQK